MTSTTLPVSRPLLLNNPALATLLGTCGALLIVASRVIETYAVMWLIGAAALVFLLLAGRGIERAVLLLLLALTALLHGDQANFGIRQVVFIALFMVFARYLVVPPGRAVVFFVIGLFANIVVRGELSALFVLAPTVLLLLIAGDRRERLLAENGKLTSAQAWRLGLIQAVSLVFPFLGSGSRGALFVWVVDSIRRVSIPTLLVGGLVLGVVASIPSVPLLNKIGGSFNELVNPAPEEGINMRAIEGLIFVTWIQTATPAEMLLGSDESIYLPGEYLGLERDPPFIPHNQIFGLVFQFGFVGLVAIFFYMVGVWRYMGRFKPGRFLFFSMMLPGFVVLMGFITPDFALIASAVNWCMMRSGTDAGGARRLAP